MVLLPHLHEGGVGIRRGKRMPVSYNGLWKLLIDKNKKTDLIDEPGISSSTLVKMSEGEVVSMGVLEKICNQYDYDFGDIINFVRDAKEE